MQHDVPAAHPLESLITAGWRLDRDAATPAYAQISARLAELVDAGDILPGDRLPGERDLAAWVGVSRMTARAALQDLAERGLVARGVGRGTFVAEPTVAHDLTSFAGFSEMARRQGLAPAARVLGAAAQPAPEDVAPELWLDPGAAVLRIERLRTADGEPVILEDSWLPAARFPRLLDRNLRGSLYDVMRDLGHAPVRAVERLRPVLAGAAHTGPLEVPAGAPLMLVERTAFSATDEPVEFARDHHRGDRARFVAHVGVPGRR